METQTRTKVLVLLDLLSKEYSVPLHLRTRIFETMLLLNPPRLRPCQEPDRECEYTARVDIDICRSCGDHADFCEHCGESNCCGARPIDTDWEPEERD